MQNIAIVCALALGGIITNDGTERGYWNSTVVVYCDIVKVDIVQKATEINGHAALSQTTTVVINPIATLAGTIDPSSSPTIRAYAEFGIGWSNERSTDRRVESRCGNPKVRESILDPEWRRMLHAE